jgi:voltage-gated potassium channel
MNTKKRILLSLAVFILVFLVGVAGFKTLGGRSWSVLDSIYMTAITITTIGYGEVHDLSLNPAARAFGIVYIIICLGTIAYAVTSITAFVVEGEIKKILGRRKMEKEIGRLQDHYIVCGSDETAQTIVNEMILTKKKFVVVESDRDKIEKLAGLGPVLIVQGDPAEDGVLEKAGIGRAKGLIACLPTDEANLFVTITARSINPGLRIVAKGIDVRCHKKIMKAGADSVISPTFIGGMRMVSEMIRPAVTTFLDMMLRERERILRFDEVRVAAGSPFIGKTIEETKLKEKTGALLVALRRGGAKEFAFNPDKTTKLGENDVLVFIASPEMAQELEKISSPGERVTAF